MLGYVVSELLDEVHEAMHRLEITSVKLKTIVIAFSIQQLVQDFMLALAL